MASSVAAQLEDLRQLRARVAAVGQPDEGMRGTAADPAKRSAAMDLVVVHTIRQALEAAAMLGGGAAHEELAEVAAAVVRSIGTTPDAALAVCDAVADGMCSALWARRGLHWTLASAARLAQHAECHGRLLGAGIVQATVKAVGGEDEETPLQLGRTHSAVGAQLDVVACIVLAFLSESEPSAALLVPTECIVALVNTLLQRLALAPGPAEAEHIVSQRLFYGLPLFYRPRFLVQALANLSLHSAAHAAAAWQTPLPGILRGLQRGTLANDTADNVPYGSPAAMEVARGLAASMLCDAAGVRDAAPDDLQAMRALAAG